MKMISIMSASFLLIGGGATVVGALDNVPLKGSDTLERVASDVLAACPNATAAGISYLGTGSSAGEAAMAAGTQTVAPMSRFLNPIAGVCDGPPAGSPGAVAGAGGVTAEGLVIGLDGIAVVAATPGASTCGGRLAFSTTRSFAVTNSAGQPVNGCSGCDAGTNIYHLSDWRDVLAITFSGRTHAMTGTTRDCNNDVRRSLVASWGNLFEDACSGSNCTSLAHAFRRADLSGTTDTFLGLVGLSSMPLAKGVVGATPKLLDFCNSNGATGLGGDSDYLDNDPIRRTCDAGEQVCERDGTTGLVTVVEVPGGLTNAANYPKTLCSLGRFRLLTPGIGTAACPNGQGLLFGKCFQPTIENADGTFNADCIARRTPVQGFQGGFDGRAYNLFAKTSTGSYRRDTANRNITGAFYRTFTTTTTVAGAPTCSADDSTEQIGCVARANGCSIGYAGREAATIAPAGSVTALLVNNKADSQANIEALVLTPTDASDDYPLARKLFFNSVVGFGNVTGGELELAKCFANNALVNPIIASRGFIQVPGGIQCQDFDETLANPAGASGCGKATRTDACTGNPAGFPNNDPLVP